MRKFTIFIIHEGIYFAAHIFEFIFQRVYNMWTTADANTNSIGRAQCDGKLVQPDFYIIFHL